jgi:catechol 2,3-dioxygenase-like lactoylglutathione lyase family enzyme
MRIEHIAFNVNDPVAMAEWYCGNLGMTVIRQGPPPANARYVADSARNTVLELYTNPPDAVPDYASMDPMVLHVAFCADDVAATRERLMAAGATPVGEVTESENGDVLAMLRDPWGLAIQLARRAEAMV